MDLIRRADAADAALVLDTSTRVAAAARSGLIDLRFAPPRFDCRISLLSVFLSALNVIKWSLINTPFEHVYVTGSQPDLLTSSHSRLPGAGRSNHKSTHTRARASPRPPPSTTSLVPPIATASGHAPPSLPPGSYPRDEARSHRSHTPFLPSSLSTLLLRREAAAAAA